MKKRKERLQREERRLQLEPLEARQLLAVGPQLAGIQPDDGSLLGNGQVRNVAPRELVFHFSDGAAIDPNTVEDGIRLLRSGSDGVFSRAVVSSDFNTDGATIIDFTARQPGEAGNGIKISVIKNNLGVGVAPRVNVVGEQISVELNATAGSTTRASQLVSAINNSPKASRLIMAAVRTGTSSSVDIAAPTINYSPLVLGGANAASATSNLNVGSNLQVKFTAVESGPDGNGIQVVIRQRDFGGVRGPQITVSDRTINIEVNSNAASPTTVSELVDAINQHSTAGSLIQSRIVSGDRTTVIGNRVNVIQLRLAGANDIEIEPGFVGLGTTTREVIMRFKETLPDDLYHVQILGTGASALRNVNGGAFGDSTDDNRDDGFDLGIDFELDLGARILSVVPQPVSRDGSNRLVQARNEIHVYFNDDDLHPTAVSTRPQTNPSVVDPKFYQLIFTNDTIQNRDDVVYNPTSISYDPAADRAVLTFARSLDLLGSGPGTFRLRIGSDEVVPLAPVSSDAALPTASTDFGTSGAVTVSFTGTADFAQRVSIRVTKSDLGASTAPEVEVSGRQILVELNTNPNGATTAQQLVAAINADADARALVVASVASGSGSTVIGNAAQATTLTLTGLGSSFDTATNLGQLGGAAQIISAAIESQPFDLPFPGSESEPGHRHLRPELGHNFAESAVPDRLDGISTLFYNFQSEYGFDPQGNVLLNAITETQKARARELFSLYEEFLGIRFVETENLGMTIVTGDPRALVPAETAGPGGAVSAFGPSGDLNGLVIMDAADFSNPRDDRYGGPWFLHAMGGVGHLLGIGFTDELPPITVSHSFLSPAGPNFPHPLAFPENTVEPIFPGAQDVSNGQHLFRPDSKDIDLFRFDVPETGRFTAETFSERLPETSLLDTVVNLYRQNPDGERELVARNDDYYSNDSYLELDLDAGTYWIGVSASGNDTYDPTIVDTGLGGRSEGDYDLRVNFRPDADRVVRDATGVDLDGDADGVPGGVFNFWFRAQTPANTIFVDKAATGTANGSLNAPFQRISTALQAADSGDIVRIVGNGGADRNLSTPADNLAYEIGFNRIGRVLADGSTLDVPKGVTVMLDNSAVVKLRRARIGVGSSSAVVDRSAGALQVLGTPVLLNSSGSVIRDLDGNALPGSVFFTSIHDGSLGVDTNPDAFPPAAAPGDWGGLSFRADVDSGETGRFSYDRQGIFLNHVAMADIRFGGGQLLVDGVPQIVTPINLTDTRPTVAYNRITKSADAAISASPNSFRESNFHELASQFTPFTADYQRVGPDIVGNTATDNSINGLFVRVATPAGNQLRPLTVSGRWDDTDIPHVLAERLVIQGTAGGYILDADTPPSQIVTLTAVPGGQLEDGDYSYRIVFVDADGNESPPSDVTSTRSINAMSGEQSIRLDNLPAATAGFVSRRLYRSNKSADPNGIFTLVAELNATSPTFTDRGASLGATLSPRPLAGLRARQDARLAIDPGVVVKLNGGSVEATFGADVYAEGADGREAVFTSVYDDRFGGGGTFDTTNDAGAIAATPGDWGGIRLGPATRGSFDHAFVAFGGGEINIEGTSTGFNALEIHQASARVAHSTFENNAGGTGGQASFDRGGRGFNREAAIFIRGAQPVIVENTLVNNEGSALSIDANSLNQQQLEDFGRSTYGVFDSESPLARVETGAGNQGPLVRLNELDFNEVNGMQIRGATLTTEGVWDDTDMVHVLRDERVYVPDFHTFGGLRLESSDSESLVVKLEGTAGIVAAGQPLDINDRIGGSVHVVGQPNHPVVMTSIHDCTVGAGFTPDGDPNNDTLNSGACDVRPDAAPFVDVVVAIDESGSMFNSQQFTKGLITELEAALQARGIGDPTIGVNQYGLVGFGGGTGHTTGHEHPVGPAGALFGSAPEYVTAVDTLQISGVLEDGYSAVQYAIDNYPWREGSERFIILATDEDRDILEPQLTFNSVLADLQANDIALQGILGVLVFDAVGNRALAVDSQNTAYLGDGAGGFTTAPLGSLFGFGQTIPDYANMIFATGGVTGDINAIAGGTGGPDATSFSNILVSQIVVQAGGGRTGAAGDWDSIRLDEYSNDRNVESILERESVDAAAPGPNATIQGAEFLGLIAPREKNDDENRRLGFELQGRLAARGDVDTYSFNGVAGTEVWFDIDFTSNSLDTVVEVIDASGQVVLARSDDSGAEAADPSLLFESPLLPAGSVLPLNKAGYDPANPGLSSSLSQLDHFTTNPRDAGMRVILPGQPGAVTTYHVRVRSGSQDSSNPNLPGLTFGNYQLQVRLQEEDEIPGSTVRYSDIRFATNGIEVLGQPAHSPLLGEATETESGATNSNDAFSSAQEIGNIVVSDRGAISVAGDLFDPADVDFFRVTIERDLVARIAPNDHFAAIFDLDYADGLGRPNASLWVFDSDGRLILTSNGSNVSDDQPRPLSGDDTEDTTRGSVGALDPFIGPVEMPAGPITSLDSGDDPAEREVYFVAVTSNAMRPEVLQQYLVANPANSLVRLEPVNSVRRIAEDRIGFSGGSQIADPPEVPVLLDPNESAVPFELGDVTLFVSQDVGLVGNTVSTLRLVDPFTGRLEATAGSFVQPISDIAMRGDGNLFSYTTGPNSRQGQFNDASIGSYVQIDTGTAATTVLNDDGVTTNIEDPANPGNAIVAPGGNNANGVGVSWDAITYRFDSDTQFRNGFVVGSRNAFFPASPNDFTLNSPQDKAAAGTEYLENVLFHFDINTGDVVNSNPNAQDRTGAALLLDAGTQRIPFGEIVTFTRLVPRFPEIGDTYTVTIGDEMIEYTAVGDPVLGFATAEEVVAGLAAEWRTKALTAEEFAAFQVLNSGSSADELRVRLIDPDFANAVIQGSAVNGGTFAFESLTVEGFGPGGRVTGIDFVNGQMYAVTNLGGLYEVDLFPSFTFTGGFFFGSNNLARYVRTSAIDLMTGDNGSPIEFSGLTAGPENAAGGRFADLLFGITRDGEIYAFNTDGELQPIFVNNQTSVDTNLFNSHGLAFSTLDRNLWTVTGNRGNDEGHGQNGPAGGDNYEPFDHSRVEFNGGSSFFFGNDRSTNRGGNQSFSNTAFVRDFNFPGGAHGSLVSQPFSLAGYSPDDLPVLYFNYFLQTEDTNYDPRTNPITPTRDSFRVFAGDDSGEWTLLATNDTFQDFVFFDEFDIDINDGFCDYPSFARHACVQPLFDNTGGWRQARISLADLAGREDIRLRFDFSTAGEMNLGDTFTVGSELRAIESTELRDGQTFTLDGGTVLEFDLGFSLVAPNGAAVDDGDSFTITGLSGRSNTFEFDRDGRFSRDILTQDGTQYRDGQTFFISNGSQTQAFEFDSGSSLQVPAAGARTGGIAEGDTFRLNTLTFEFDSDGAVGALRTPINTIVDQAIRLPAAGAGPGGITDGEQFLINDGQNGPNTVFEFDSNGVTVPGARSIGLNNVEIQVPVAGGGFGGVRDGQTFRITSGATTVFEFDTDNAITPGNVIVAITSESTQNDVANAMVAAMRNAGIGLNPTNQGGGTVRVGVFRHTVNVSATPTMQTRTVAATVTEIADRAVDRILNSSLGLLNTAHVGNGVINLGSTQHVVNVSLAPSLSVRPVLADQDQLADRIADAILNAGLGILPINVGGGEVFLGSTTLLDTSGSATLSDFGEPGPNDLDANPVVFDPTQSAASIAFSIASAVNGSTLNLVAASNGNLVDLPANASFSPNGLALRPAGVTPILFDADQNSDAVATSIQEAILAAFAPVQLTADLTAEGNDTRASAVVSGMTGGPAVFEASGFIGDNTAFPLERGLDVDLVRMDLAAGDQLRLTTTRPLGSSLSPALRLFDVEGRELASAAGSFFAAPSIDFSVISSGTYYVSVSGSANRAFNPDFAGSADVTLIVPAAGGALGGLTDGENFLIDPKNGDSPVLFEFDNNGIVRTGAVSISLADLVLELPSTGTGFGGVQDGDFFVINDNVGSGDVIFEFDSNNAARAGAIRIPFAAGDNAAQLASATIAALQSANLGLSPSSLSNNKIILGTTTHTVDLSGAPNLNTSNLPRTQQNILVQIRDAIRRSGLGLNPQLGFSSIALDVEAHRVDATLAPNLSKIVPSSTGAYDLVAEVINPLQALRANHRVNLAGVQNVTQSGLPNSFIDGRPGATASNRTAVPVDFSMTKEQVARATADGIGRAVSGYDQQILAVDGSQIADGEIFSVSDGQTTVNFEFESGFSLQIPNPATDPNAFLDGEFFRVSTSSGSATFEFDNNGSVSQGNAVRFNDLAIRIPQGGMTSAQLNDGDRFTVNRGPGTSPTVFEYDTDGVVAAGNRSIRVTNTATELEVANATAQALLNAGIGLNPRVVSGTTGFFTTTTEVRLGIVDHTVNTQNAPGLITSFVQLSQDEISRKLVRLISGAGLNLTPTYLGNGLIHLGGFAGDGVDTSNAVSLQVIGSPGVFDSSAIPIPLFPSINTTATDVAQLIQSAINTARGSRGLNVTATLDGVRRVNLNGPTVVTDVSQAPSLPLISAGESVSTYENIVRVIGHTVTNPGPLGFEGSLAGDDPFGAFETSGPPQITQYPGALRAMDNAHEGVYVDDIVIGFAERGEIVTGATVDTDFIFNDELLNPELPDHNEIHSGPYQLEIRGAEEFGRTLNDPEPEIFLQRTFDTNARLTNAVSLSVPAGHAIAEAETFSVSDGTKTVVFEFDDLAINNGVRPGNVRIGYNVADSAPVMARRIRDAVNSTQVQALLEVQAAMSDGVGIGTRISPRAPESSSSLIHLFGNAVVSFEESQSVRTTTIGEPSDTVGQAVESGIGTEGVTRFFATGSIGDNAAIGDAAADVDLVRVDLSAGQTMTVDIDARAIGSFLDSVLRVFNSQGSQVALNDDFNGLDSFLTFTATTSGPHYVGVSSFFNFFYSPFVAGSGTGFGFSTGDYEITISTSGSNFATTESTDLGDSNVKREQGQILIHANQISDSLNFGIRVDAGDRDGDANAPHQGPPRVTREVNSNRLAPGPVLENNVIARSGMGGILFSGEVNAANEQPGAVPFGRIINNTIFGGAVGIQVEENASPTLMNNIVASTGTGVSVDASSNTTVMSGTLYKENGTNASGIGLGSFPLVLGDNDPLFVNALAGNFYPAFGSRAIDSSVDSIQDRPEMVSLKSPLGLGPSPILAPDLDRFGQARVDDPNVDSPPGQGANVFKDRGAVDRADFAGPTAVLLNPKDNDAKGRDGDARDTFVELLDQVVTQFSIQLKDGVEPDDPQDGTGPDDRTVISENVILTRDGERLVEGTDYKFSYDATSNIIRITPLAGIFEPDRVYEIELSNSVGFVIDAPSGTEVSDGQQFQLTDNNGSTATFEYESGFSLRVPQTLTIQVPEAGGIAIQDGDTFVISDDSDTVTYEFDSNGVTLDANGDGTPDNTVITFQEDDSANLLANKIVAAVANTSALDLSPKNIENFFGRAVHLGSQSIHTLDTTSSGLTQTGVAGGIEPGQTFTIDDGTKVVTFEFTTTTGAAETRDIVFSFGQTHEEIADRVAAAINGANVQLNATHPPNSEGLVHLGGTTRHQVDVGNSQLSLSGTPGVQAAFGIQIPTVAGAPDFSVIQDGQTFTISNGTKTVTFELDDNGTTAAGNRVITFNSNTTTNQLANAIALSVRNAQLGLSPSNDGNGVISLGGTTAHSLDVSNTALTQLGQPGVAAARAIEFIPGDSYEVGIQQRNPVFTSTEMAVSIADSINSAVADGLMSGVVATPRDDEVIVDGVASVGGSSVSFRSNIRDLAANPLKPNRDDGSTRFTIFIGTGLDYGDAPSSYGTLEADNGPRHEVVADFFLGAAIDVDVNGQPTADASGDDNDGLDDEDGVVFGSALPAGGSATVVVTASKAGMLDAWIDFNGNGIFEHPSEFLFFSVNQPVSRAVVAGSNTFTINVPGMAAGGNTFARFRLSSNGGLSPLGPAADGEVEDHRVSIIANPWRNPANPHDVTGDGKISPIDALVLINNINRFGSRDLPNPPVPPNTPPPFLDVNGDGRITPVGDVNPVITALNQPSGEGEGEFGGEPLFASAPLADSAQVAPLTFGHVVDHRIALDTSDDEDERAGQQVRNVDPQSVDLDAWRLNATDGARGDISQGRDGLEDLLDDLAADVARDLDAHELAFGGEF